MQEGKNMNRELNNIINLVVILNEKKYKEIKSQFNHIKKHNIKNEAKIERLLDGLLDIINTYDDKKSTLLFIKICLYYYNINPNNAEEYYQIYLETLENKDLKIKTKMP